MLQDAEETLKHSVTAKNSITAQLLSDIEKALLGIQSRDTYNAGGHHYLQQQQQSHWAQRATHSR